MQSLQKAVMMKLKVEKGKKEEKSIVFIKSFTSSHLTKSHRARPATTGMWWLNGRKTSGKVTLSARLSLLFSRLPSPDLERL